MLLIGLMCRTLGIVPQLIVSCFHLLIRKDFVCLTDLLELFHRFFAIASFIWMVLLSKLIIALFYSFEVICRRHTHKFVVVIIFVILEHVTCGERTAGLMTYERGARYVCNCSGSDVVADVALVGE